MSEDLYTVRLPALDWEAVVKALRWHADIRPLDKHVAFYVGQDRLRYIADQILMALPVQ